MLEDQRNLKDLAGIGPAMLRDLHQLGIHTVEALSRRDPKQMYRDLCRLKGEVQDICCLDVFTAAVAQALDPHLPVEQSQWWFYSKRRKQSELKKTRIRTKRVAQQRIVEMNLPEANIRSSGA